MLLYIQQNCLICLIRAMSLLLSCQITLLCHSRWIPVRELYIRVRACQILIADYWSPIGSPNYTRENWSLKINLFFLSVWQEETCFMKPDMLHYRKHFIGWQQLTSCQKSKCQNLLWLHCATAERTRQETPQQYIFRQANLTKFMRYITAEQPTVDIFLFSLS